MPLQNNSDNADAPELQRRVLTAQVQLLFDRTRASNITNLAGTLLVVMLLWRAVPHAPLLGWLSAQALLFLARQWVRWRFTHRDGWDDVAWRRKFSGVVVATGVVWGVGVAYFALVSPMTNSALLIATLIVVVAIAGMTLALYEPLFLAYSAAALLPTALTQLAQGGRVGIYAGAGLLLFAAFVWIEGRVAARQIVEMLRLRLLLEQEAQAHARAVALAERHSAVKGQFLATMSHEMRTPLHGILGLAGQLRDAEGSRRLDERALGSVGLIERSGGHLLALINDVLDFAKIEAGHMRLEAEPFDLAAVIEEVVALGGSGAREKGLGIEVDTTGLGPAGSWMRGDAARVRQVLHNLLGNAIKFTEQGQVRILAERDSGSGRVIIEVEDSGTGIAARELQRIFEAFHQAEGSFDRRHAGTGLGLTIARELARAMGGELRARSIEGVGSVFRFEAPLAPAQPDTLPGESMADTQPLAPVRLLGRVLVAEDNPVNALVVEAMLRQFGVEVELVENGAQAVDRWQQCRPDLLLMDCQMPEMDGFAATRAIRERERAGNQPRVPIVALTANAYESDRERCLAAGMDEHLPKPFREDALRSLLASYLVPAHAHGAGSAPAPLDISL